MRRRPVFVLALGLLLVLASGAPAQVVAKVVGLFDKVELLRQGGSWEKLEKGAELLVKDVVRTGPRGRVRIEFLDRDPTENAGPSVANLGSGTEVAIESFLVRFDDPRKREGVLDLIKGTIRAFAKGWGRSSIFSVKAGVSLCGIRGSEQIVRYDPTGGRDGMGKTWQTALSGVIVTDSTDPAYPETKQLSINFQRYMTGQDPATWIDIPLTEARRQQLIEQTEVPGNDGKTEEERHVEEYGEGAGLPDGTGEDPLETGELPEEPGDPYLGFAWTSDGLPDCTAKALDIMLNSYAWDDLQDFQNFTFYQDELVSGRFVVSGAVETTCVDPRILRVEVSADGGRSFVQARFNPETLTFRYAFDPTGFAQLDLRVRATFDRERVDAYRELTGLEP